MKCGCDPHIEYCDICFPPEKRHFIVKPRNGKPLTDEELKELWKEHGYKSAMCMKFARAIERAHGIGD